MQIGKMIAQEVGAAPGTTKKLLREPPEHSPHPDERLDQAKRNRTSVRLNSFNTDRLRRSRDRVGI
jgi:hypothetical protein